ncbi:hypothetical protein GCM10020331_052320 [Ectobacillus funiculus]
MGWAAENGRLEANTVTYRDLLDTKIMACFVPLPSEMNRLFLRKLRARRSGSCDEVFFYQFFKKMSIIFAQIASQKNEMWIAPTEYGGMEITINLSKPEKKIQGLLQRQNILSKVIIQVVCSVRRMLGMLDV